MVNKTRLTIEPLEGYEPEIGRGLWAVQDTRGWTLKELESLPDGSLDRPGPVGKNTIGTLLYHIALIEMSWLYDDALATEVPADIAALFPVDDRDEAGILRAMQGHDLDSYLSRLAMVREKLLEAYKEMTLEDYRRAKSLPQYDVSPEWVLYHLVEHEVEHRGHIQVIVESLRA